MTPTRVLLIAADPLARAGLSAMLAEEAGVDVVAQVDQTGDWDQTLAVFRPEAVLWDLGWEPAAPEPGLLADFGVPVVLLVPDGGPFEDFLAAGVGGLLLRSASPPQIAAALQAVTLDLVALAPELAAVLVPSAPSTAQPGDFSLPRTPLTGRENEVLHLMAAGLTNKAIAHRLGISPHTVKFHITGILAKLDAQSRTEAVTHATRAGILPI